MNFPIFVTFDITQDTCFLLESYSYLSTEWFWMTGLLADIIPFGLLLAGNIYLASSIVVANRRRANQLQNQGGTMNANEVKVT